MKKDILFIMNSLNCGGAEKALVSLLQVIDYNRYNVDLYLFKKEGMFIKDVPKEVTILQQPKNYSFFDMSIKKAIVQNLKKGNFKLIFYRMLAGFVYKIEKKPVVREQKAWKYLKKVIPSLSKKYVAAIGYLEKTPNYFCIDKVNAKIKIGFVHTDLEKLGIDFIKEQKYLTKLDHIITVSKELRDRLSLRLPFLSSKITFIENIVSKNKLIKLSNEPMSISLDKNYFNILYVGRLAKEKGLFFGLDAIEILIKKEYKIKWLIIGEGNKKEELEKASQDKGIRENIIFLGFKENPYPYMKECDLFLLPSFYEGKSISLEEVKLLHKPIVVTNFSSAQDQIVDNKTGLISEFTPKSIADNIERLFVSNDLRESFIKNLSLNMDGTESEINKLYNILEN
ncbi:glycosyltransferase [Lutibacter sp. A80]|uniref:glycosyltransferase n=1 Tax=Lutibacter sp. A80 TaxID=2918453 RepID=UPI001F05EE17|nr:glycosyltransferase [Lutibacter sp. A80]UMB60338.1 glycosyltransferase [Lutibacter sp. A80]